MPPSSPEKTPRQYPNRIFELMKARGWTYAELADRVSRAALARGDEAHAKVHEVTINRLALGTAQLTQQWMNILAEVLHVPPHEIITAPPVQNLQRVPVSLVLEAGRWRAPDQPAAPDRPDEIMVRIESELTDAKLYAGEIHGPYFDLRYPDRSIVWLSEIEQKPGEIAEGKRYHIRATRYADSHVLDSIRRLCAREGRYWLAPESSDPNGQAWLPLAGTDEFRIEIKGRVRGVFFRED